MRGVHIVDYNLDFGGLDNRTMTDAIVVHHTGNPTDDNCSAKQIHASHQAQGWSGIGYHYVIRKDGTIKQGRPHWVVGAHAYGDNNHTIGVHLSGNFEIGHPTQEQIESAALLIGKLCEDYGLTPDAKHVAGIAICAVTRYVRGRICTRYCRRYAVRRSGTSRIKERKNKLMHKIKKYKIH